MSDLFNSDRCGKTSYDKGMLNTNAPVRKPKIPWKNDDKDADKKTSEDETGGNQPLKPSSESSQQDVN